jgi:glycosyltransferase involved in cell wall biosynthesis
MKKLLLHLLYTITLLLLFCSHPAHAAERNKSFVILIHSCNDKDFVKKNLDSVFTQSWDGFKVIYIDDASLDGTADLVEKYIQKNSLHQKISLIKNEIPAGILSNLQKGAKQCSPDQILLLLEGSDWLAHRQVLEQLNAVYADPNVWLTYGQYCSYPDYSRGDAVYIPLSAIENPSHIRSTFACKTCYAGLLQQIKEEDSGATSPHQILLAALLQLAHLHASYIPDIHYIYNTQHKKNILPKQIPPLPLKKIYISSGYWGEMFAVDDPNRNRDNSLDVMDRLRKVARDAGYELLLAHDLSSLQDFERLIVFDVFLDQQKDLARYPQEKKVLFLWEPPSVIPENYRVENHRDFSKIFTWHDGLVDNEKYFKFYYPVLHPMIDTPIDFHAKNLCTMIACNKYSSQPGELYSERLNLIHFFEYGRHPGFTLYGKFWPERYRVYGGSIEKKVDILKNFRFCFAYENIRGIPGYVTEKIFDCFRAGTVPIYWGAPNISHTIPKNCFISREDFPDNASLYAYLATMEEERYLSYLENIRAFLLSKEAQKYSQEHFISLFMQLITTPTTKDLP